MFVLIFICLGQSSVKALNFTFEVVDSIARTVIPNAEVQIFEPGDSVLISDKVKFFDNINSFLGVLGSRMSPRSGYFVVIPNGVDFDVVINAEGYYERIVPVSSIKGRNVYYGEVGLEKLPKQLDEVTVTATKIRMYYKGDTLVYNADAFLLPDGSMLDDLIRKLDGVTIDRSGQIFCRGRKVHSLLLEGRKFYNGDPRILMQNLAAYTVKNIKVYDYTDETEKFLGYGDQDSKPMVMDVVLKKEYSIGKWLNVDAGYGTSDRYLGRLFALGFSKNTSISAFLNANNLSTGDNPQRGDEWDPSKARNDESTYLSGGLSYSHQIKGSATNRVRGTLSVNSDKTVDRLGRERTNYLSGGDTYMHTYDYSRSKVLRVATDHTLYLQYSKVNLTVNPRFSYSKNDGSNSTVSATFDKDFGKVTSAEIDSVYSSSSSGQKEMLRHLINRNLNRSERNGTNLNVGLNASSTFKLPETDHFRHNITLGANGGFARTEGKNFSRYTINYGENPTPANMTYAYGRTRPENSTDLSASFRYETNINRKHTISLNYQYTNSRSVNTFDRYLLSDLAETSPESLKFGQVPSEDELAGVIDPVNSKHTLSVNNYHRVFLTASLMWGNSNLDVKGNWGSLRLFASPGVRIVNRRYDYSRPTYDTTAVRNSVLPAVNASLMYSMSRPRSGYSITTGARWESTPELFGMDNLINVVNDMDPLHLYFGNSKLKNSYEHATSVYITFNRMNRPMQTHRLEAGYNMFQDRISSGGVYNSSTGVYRTSVYNVNGSDRYHVEYTGTGDLKTWENKAAKKLAYELRANYSLDRDASLVGIASAGEEWVTPSKRYVYNQDVSSLAKLSFYFAEAEHCISVEWNGSFNKYWGDEDYFMTQNTRDFNYRVSGDFVLPQNIKLSTQFTLRTRRGYAESELNTNEYIWNASASWLWKKPRLTFIVDAYDILRQINSISTYVNAFGRTETWRNTLPSYVLFRVRYHLDITPKR